MKVLSVKQPWASLLLEYGKDAENRSWTTEYRGPLIIHASQSSDRDLEDVMETVNFAAPSKAKETYQRLIVKPAEKKEEVRNFKPQAVWSRPYPAYAFQNLASKIRRVRERVKFLPEKVPAAIGLPVLLERAFDNRGRARQWPAKRTR